MSTVVDRIKERLDIAEVIEGYIPLSKAGGNFKACCPFHQEKTPSFFVSPSRNTYYCFGCGAKGDIFTFVEALEGLSFKEALLKLGERAGIPLEELRTGGPSHKEENEEVYKVLEEATRVYRDALSDPQVKKYLLGRGLESSTLASFEIGWAADEWRVVRDYFHDKGISDETLIRAGLIKKNEEGKPPYDVFRGRIMFPLKDQSGRIVGFTGRALFDHVTPKYLNSPDSEIFDKSSLLFALDKARVAIRQKDYAVLVEGQMDTLLAHQVGIQNVIATSGTAVTEKHLHKLSRLTKRLIIAFDGDEAGTKAAVKTADSALRMGFDVKIAKLPDSKDPADLCRENPDMFRDALRSAHHVVIFLAREIITTSKSEREKMQRIVKELLPRIALVQSAVERAHFILEVSRISGASEEALHTDLRRLSLSEHRKVYESPAPTKTPVTDRIERHVAGALWWIDVLGEKLTDEQKNSLLHRISEEERGELKSRYQNEKEELLFEVERYYDGENLVRSLTELFLGYDIDQCKKKQFSIASSLSHAQAVGNHEESTRLLEEMKHISARLVELDSHMRGLAVIP